MSRRNSLLAYSSLINAIQPSPTNEIWYTSTDGNVVTPYATDVFGANIVSNTYSNGKGIIKFDGDITSIGTWAFYRCSLTSVTIPDSVTTIGDSAFYGCSCLTSITIPNGVMRIGYGVFWGCGYLTSIIIPESVTEIGEYAFHNCMKLTSINIHDGIVSIGNRAFMYCYKLTSITIPDSVTEIGNSAFMYCSSLTSVYCKATTPPTLDGTSVFGNNGSGRKIYVPYQSLYAYKTATNWSEYASDIVGYDFENDVVIITFTVRGTEYQAEDGMTWEDWVNSEYSNNTFFISGNNINTKETGESIWNTDGTLELKTNSIINGYGYILFCDAFPI